MNRGERYRRQAEWTRELREYIFEKAGLARARRILEVGCGGGAVLSGVPRGSAARFGLDLDPAALGELPLYAPGVFPVRADGRFLPFARRSFDIAFCHYLLLWVKEPLQVVREMARVARFVIAFAEPDYSRRIDEPPELKAAGALQTEALRRQGADPFFGARLAETFFRAGIRIEEAGEIRPSPNPRLFDGQEQEWAAMESDLLEILPPEEVQKIKALDAQARKAGTRVLRVPTFFAWGESEV